MFKSHNAAEVNDFDAADHMERKRAKRLDRYSHFSVASAQMAITDAGIDLTTEDRDQIGSTMGSALGGLQFAEEQLNVFLRECVANWEKGGGHFAWLLCLKGTDTPIGSIGITLEGGGKAMFGYALAKKFWRHGFAAEALTFLVEWSLAQPGIFRAYAFCDVENPASARVMEKAGMVREGLLRRWHVAPTLGPEPRDCIVCAKIK